MIYFFLLLFILKELFINIFYSLYSKDKFDWLDFISESLLFRKIQKLDFRSMVSLDEQIQKDRQKNKAHRGNRNISRGADRVNRRFKQDRRGPTDKRRGIRKDTSRREGGQRFRQNRDRQNRGPRRDRNNNRDNRPEQRRNIKKSRISRAPRKPSQDNNNTEAVQKEVRTLRVMGLHPDFSNEDLYKLFSTEGALQKCLIEQDNFGRSLTTAIVKYHNASSAKSAITNLNQHKVMNSILTVEPYKNKRR